MLHQNPDSPLDGERDIFDDHGDGLVGNISIVPHRRVILMDLLLNASQILAHAEHWQKTESKGPGGRPARCTFRILLVVLLILAVEHSPLSFRDGGKLIAYRLGPESLALLGVEPGGSWRRWEGLLQHAFARLVGLMDPHPEMKWKRWTNERWMREIAKRDPDRIAEMWRRLDWFCNELITLAVVAYPKMDNWYGNRVIDGTAFSVFSKRGQNSQSTFMSSQPDGGWYLRDANHRVPGRGRRAVKAFFGFEIHLVVATSNTGDISEDKYPHVYVGISFGRPGEAPAHLGLKAIHASHIRFNRNNPTRDDSLIVGDRGYFANSKDEDLQIPVRNLGFRIMTDYKVDQLGEKGGYMGAIQVEGAWYCPAMPADLINATKDVRAHRIDFETWRTRIDSREKYLLRRKQKPDARGDVPMMCPAIGPNATLDCPWRQGQRKAEWDLIKDKRRRTKTPFPVLESQLPDRRLPICTNKASVTFPLATDAKYIQAIRFGTKTWKKLYSHARNMIESANRYVKDDAKEALSSEGRRRARGSSQQYVMVSMLIFAANLRRINTHKFGQPYTPRTIPDIRRRDITNGYLYDPETNTGIAPNAGMPGGFIADDVFSGDIQGAAVDWAAFADGSAAGTEEEEDLPAEEIDADD